MGRINILININMFKLSVVVCSMLLGTILSQGQEDSFDAKEVALRCTANTPLGDKMAYALNICFEEEDEKDMAGKGGKGKKEWKGRKDKFKKDQCPSVEDIIGSIEEEMEGDMCIMAVLGWIDESGEFNEQAMKEDISSLPEEVSAQLTEEAVDECATEMMTMMAKEHANTKCSEAYSEEDVASLTEAGMMFAASKCFNHMFLQSCKNSMAEMKGEDRLFGLFGILKAVTKISRRTRIQCFSTCQAAGFAATTTCSGQSLIAGLWQTSDIPCNELYPLAG